METEARTHMFALHYQNHVKVRRAREAEAADPTNDAVKVRLPVADCIARAPSRRGLAGLWVCASWPARPPLFFAVW